MKTWWGLLWKPPCPVAGMHHLQTLPFPLKCGMLETWKLSHLTANATCLITLPSALALNLQLAVYGQRIQLYSGQSVSTDKKSTLGANYVQEEKMERIYQSRKYLRCCEQSCRFYLTFWRGLTLGVIEALSSTVVGFPWSRSEKVFLFGWCLFLVTSLFISTYGQNNQNSKGNKNVWFMFSSLEGWLSPL